MGIFGGKKPSTPASGHTQPFGTLSTPKPQSNRGQPSNIAATTGNDKGPAPYTRSAESTDPHGPLDRTLLISPDAVNFVAMQRTNSTDFQVLPSDSRFASNSVDDDAAPVALSVGFRPHLSPESRASSMYPPGSGRYQSGSASSIQGPMSTTGLHLESDLSMMSTGTAGSPWMRSVQHGMSFNDTPVIVHDVPKARADRGTKAGQLDDMKEPDAPATRQTTSGQSDDRRQLSMAPLSGAFLSSGTLLPVIKEEGTLSGGGSSNSDIYDMIEEDNDSYVPNRAPTRQGSHRVVTFGSKVASILKSGRSALEQPDQQSSHSLSAAPSPGAPPTKGMLPPLNTMNSNRSDMSMATGGAGAGTRPSRHTPSSRRTPSSAISSGFQSTRSGLNHPWSKNRLDSFRKAQRVEWRAGEDELFVNAFKKPDPQETVPFSSTPFMRFFVLANVASGTLYLYWRVQNTRSGVPTMYLWWYWLFFATEAFLMIAVWIGHTQRLFPVQRVKVTMDEVCFADPLVGINSQVAILLPTAGEKLDVVFKCLLGATSQRLWNAEPLTRSQVLRVIVLDEKRRREVHNLCLGVYEVAKLILTDRVLRILQAEGLKEITPRGFAEWCKESGGFERKHLYNDVQLNRACNLINQMDQLVLASAGGKAFALKGYPADKKTAAMRDPTAGINIMADLDDKIEPGTCRIWNDNPQLPILIYYSRLDVGMPKISPKAGNMNSVLFPSPAFPDQPALIGESTIAVVNDARHQLAPNFLQRTVPYFFELDKETNSYRWARVAFVQTPQRFPGTVLEDDPLGNHAAVQYDVINHGKDGIGAVSSSGQGSLWRVDALKGVRADGSQYADPDDPSLIGSKTGFRAQMLIEDTHTSIDIFREGWTSRYVNEPGEVLAWCTHQPNSVFWRTKQVLRWHQGGAQLLLFKGIRYTSFGGNFATIWHRIYAFDQATYYLQAIPGYVLLLMPIIYGCTSQPPFSTTVGTFMTYFVPFIVTAMLPTAIASQWRKVDSDRLTRDEQVWLSTTYVQIYAFLQTVWAFITRAKPEDAWVAKVPVWPLMLVFVGEIAAIGGACYWLSQKGVANWYQSFTAVLIACVLALHSLWPMVSLQMGWKAPSFYYFKLVAWLCLGVGVIVLTNVNN